MAYSVSVTRNNGKPTFLIVLHKESMERIMANDPAIVEGNLLSMVAPELAPLQLKDVDFVVAYEPDAEAFAELAKANRDDSRKLLHYLARGWQVRPEDTDAIKVVTTNVTPGESL